MTSIFRTIEELMLSEREVLDAKTPGETDKRVAALHEIQRNIRYSDSNQLAEVMTTASFTDYFSNIISRSFYQAYQMKAGAWKNYTYGDTVPDFRVARRFRMSLPETLLLRREKAEAKATFIDEDYIYFQVEEYARQFDVSWRALISDDLGEIAQTPKRMAEAAARFEDTFVSNLYDNATSQAALIALGAVYAGTGRLTAANLAIGINAMFQRTDTAGNQIIVPQAILVVPPVLEIQARVLMQSALMPGVATNDKNVLPGFISGVYVDPYITFAGANIPWYLFASPSSIPAVTVARLDGFNGAWVYKKASDVQMVMGSAPSQFQMGSFATGDIEYAVEDVIGARNHATLVGITDANGIYYSSGTTP